MNSALRQTSGKKGGVYVYAYTRRERHALPFLVHTKPQLLMLSSHTGTESGLFTRHGALSAACHVTPATQT